MARQKPTVAYRWFKDPKNFEGIQWGADGNDLLVTWIWAGCGEVRQPVATVHKGRVVVTWTDGATWSMPSRVAGGAKMDVQLAKG